ncbi:MAG: DNA-binding protein [Prevotellaceae bacterium]|jgi:predicted transcriptional regulator|nr:DNA-binding protein [Prevotellaceae bacterium]
METITFNQLRRIKDALPDGSTHKIADLLGVTVDTVRNFFGGNHLQAQTAGVHYEQGPDGGLVTFDDPTMLNLARKILEEHKIVVH